MMVLTLGIRGLRCRSILKMTNGGSYDSHTIRTLHVIQLHAANSWTTVYSVRIRRHFQTNELVTSLFGSPPFR